MPREGGTAGEVPKVPEARRGPRPGGSSGPRSRPGWEVSARYRGPELYNYHGRLSYFGKRLCCCQSFYSSKPKQDGKSPAQDAASGGRGEFNLLAACTGAAGSPCCTRHHPHRDGAGDLGCPGGFAGRFGGKIWGHGGHRVSARHGMGLGSAPCSAAGRSGGHMFGCFPASVRTSIFSSFSCKGSRFGAFPARWLGRGMPCAWTGAPRCCSQ